MSSVDVYLQAHGFVRKARIIGKSNCGFAWFKNSQKQGEIIVESDADSISVWIGQELLLCTANKSAAILCVDELLEVKS